MEKPGQTHTDEDRLPSCELLIMVDQDAIRFSTDKFDLTIKEAAAILFVSFLLLKDQLDGEGDGNFVNTTLQ